MTVPVVAVVDVITTKEMELAVGTIKEAVMAVVAIRTTKDAA